MSVKPVVTAWRTAAVQCTGTHGAWHAGEDGGTHGAWHAGEDGGHTHS